MNFIKPVDWERIASTVFVYEEGCWNSMCDSLCCRSKVPGANFQLIREQGVHLLYLPGEYEYHLGKNTLPVTIGNENDFKTWKFDFGRSTCLEVHWQSCLHEGGCKKPSEKPLICRCYPFLPILDLDGNLEELCLLNVFDLTIEAMELKRRCNLMELREKYTEQWNNHPEALEPLRHPYLIFYLQVAKLICNNFLDALSKNEKLKGKQGEQFWRAWEMEYLFGRLLNQEALRTDVAQLYDRVVQKYGEMDLHP